MERITSIFLSLLMFEPETSGSPLTSLSIYVRRVGKLVSPVYCPRINSLIPIWIQQLTTLFNPTGYSDLGFPFSSLILKSTDIDRNDVQTIQQLRTKIE